jgi:hypothetical protein
VSSENEFRNTDQEVQKLLEECGELRQTLKTISAQLSRIESRVKTAFPAVAKKIHDRKILNLKQRESSLTSEQAQIEFDEIVRLAGSNNPSEAEQYLNRQSAADLYAIAREVGVSFLSNKPSLKTLRQAILGKVRESILLSRHSPRV